MKVILSSSCSSDAGSDATGEETYSPSVVPQKSKVVDSMKKKHKQKKYKKLDTQLFDREDPQVKLRRERKSFNLKSYKTAMGVEDIGIAPEALEKMTPKPKSEIKDITPMTPETLKGITPNMKVEKFKKTFPGVVSTVEAMIRWYDNNFTNKLPPMGSQVAKDVARRPLD